MTRRRPANITYHRQRHQRMNYINPVLSVIGEVIIAGGGGALVHSKQAGLDRLPLR